jgi:hypothetical protein
MGSTFCCAFGSTFKGSTQAAIMLHVPLAALHPSKKWSVQFEQLPQAQVMNERLAMKIERSSACRMLIFSLASRASGQCHTITKTVCSGCAHTRLWMFGGLDSGCFNDALSLTRKSGCHMLSSERIDLTNL